MESIRTELSRSDIVIHWTLRLACTMCFIGHGAFGFITKESWTPFFAYFGIGREAAFDLMPLIGGMDITLGLLVLLRPRKILLAYMATWAVFTALLRPLTGMSGWECIERAGNYGAPLALLLLGDPGWRLRDWFGGFGPQPIHRNTLKTGITVLQFTTAGLLIGHGALGLFVHKPLLLYHWSFLPYISTLAVIRQCAELVGLFEIGLGLVVLLYPAAPLLVFVFGWKIGTELLYFASGDPVWEFIERGGSYGAPLGLFYLITTQQASSNPHGLSFGGFWHVALLRRMGLALSPRANWGTVLGFFACLVAGLHTWHTTRIHTLYQYHQLPYVISPTAVDLGSGETLLKQLQAGGLILYFRHFATRPLAGIDDPLRMAYTRLTLEDFHDCSWQRPLSAEGMQQARTVGDSLRQLNIPVGQVISSPYCRCINSAEEMLAVAPSVQLELMRPTRAYYSHFLFETAVHQFLLNHTTSAGTNTVVVSHTLPIRRLSYHQEGEAYAFQADAKGGYRLVGQILPAEWEAAQSDLSQLGRKAASRQVPGHH